MDIATCTERDLDDWAALRFALWPDEPLAVRRSECQAMLARAPAEAIDLIARDAGGAAIGFAEAAVRRDYVNGCDTSPVAFLEGIYVAPAHRNRGIGRALRQRVIAWARALGLSELASDALLENTASHRFHAAIGFEETERAVYFRMPI